MRSAEASHRLDRGATGTPTSRSPTWWERALRRRVRVPHLARGPRRLGRDGGRGARRQRRARGRRRGRARRAATAPTWAARPLIQHGTPEQQQRFVAPMGRGTVQWCQLFSEPGAGSDLASLATKAERDGDEFVITGQKVWNSKADVSEWGMLLCRTDPDVPKHRGMSFVMIDMHQPGVEVRPLVQMNGSAEFCEVFLTEARARVADVDRRRRTTAGTWPAPRSRTSARRPAAGKGRGPGHRRGRCRRRQPRPHRRRARRRGEAGERSTARKRTEVLLSSRVDDRRSRPRPARSPTRRAATGSMRYHVHSEVYRLNGQRIRDLAKARAACPLDGSTVKLDLAMLAHESRDLSLSLLGAEAMLSATGDATTARAARRAVELHRRRSAAAPTRSSATSSASARSACPANRGTTTTCRSASCADREDGRPRPTFRLTDDEIWAFVTDAHTGIMTTLRRDGMPISMPLWFACVDRAIYVHTRGRKLQRARARPAGVVPRRVGRARGPS